MASNNGQGDYLPIGEAPLTVTQWYYKACGHVYLAPKPEPGQKYRITAYFDTGGRCLDCRNAAKETRAHEGTKGTEYEQPTLF